MQRRLNSFHADKNVQFAYVDHVHKWLDVQMAPKTAREIAESILATRRVIKPSDCVLENLELFTKELELPEWLFNLLMTINHHFSNGFDGLKETYESWFYERFLFACNVGVDYTPMFHQWEAYVLGDFLPESVSGNVNVVKAVELHNRSLNGEIVARDEWLALHTEVEKVLNDLNDHDNDKGRKLLWTAHRAVFLSIEEVIKPEEHWTSSVEAAIDAKCLDVIIDALAKGRDTKRWEKFDKILWRGILDDVLDMVSSWQNSKEQNT